jgi:hypothetical protein
MSERVMPRDAQTQITTIPNKSNSLKLVYNDATDTNDSISVQDDIAEYQAGDGVNTTYRTRTKTKVLWTGPLSVVSTPTSLDVGEKFSDWDFFVVVVNLESDTNNFSVVEMPIHKLTSHRFYRDSFVLGVQFNDDTTFEIFAKTMAAANVVEIRGISL